MIKLKGKEFWHRLKGIKFIAALTPDDKLLVRNLQTGEEFYENFSTFLDWYIPILDNKESDEANKEENKVLPPENNS